ncbi:MAG: DUF1080 domain-containing protein [Verrucomicrobiales bacterium]|jgi:sugar phosphate isomerase/epimerase|nr:DUF1080 domain-containing protein [Verrucomicrobiales bacterium]
MKSILKNIMLCGALIVTVNCFGAEPQIGMQAYTFRNLTFFETVDKARELGIGYLEAYPGQKLGGDLEGKFGHDLSPDAREKIREKLRSAGVTLVSYGVVNAGGEQDWRKIFDFAKDMKLQWITTEPPVDKLPMLDKLAVEYGIPLALHNHATPSTYADPEKTRAALEPLSLSVGVCADTGHYGRSGFEPAKALALLKGRIITLHLADINQFTKSGRDVPFGSGVGNMAAVLAELRRQGFKGIPLIEYEHMSPKLTEEVAACVAFLRQADAHPEQLAKSIVIPPGNTDKVSDVWANGRGKDSQKWEFVTEDLFKPDLSNADFAPGSWVFEKGILSAKGGGELWTQESYGDFILNLDFRCEEKTNSGVFLRCSDTKDWLHNTIEVQILQGDSKDGTPSREVCGSIFDVLAPQNKKEIKPGQWYHYTIIAKGSEIRVMLDGQETTKINLDEWTEPHKNPDGSKNKFNKAYKDMARKGRIGLQYHGNPIEFRNLTIEKL